jgi:predicted  nucleic acid-binding Zn-ribbon protein
MYQYMPKWKETNKETYIKMLESRIEGIERKRVKSVSDSKRLEGLKRELDQIKK